MEGELENEEEEVNGCIVCKVTIPSAHFEVGTETIPLHLGSPVS